MHHYVAFVGVDDGAELALVVGDMLAMLVLAALYLLITAGGKLFSHIPIVGGTIHKWFDYAARAMRSATIDIWHANLWALGKMAHAASVFMQNIVNGYHLALTAIEDAIEHQAYVRLPREISAARKYADSQAAAALRTALQYADSVKATARKWADQARAYADSQDAALRKWTLDTIRAVSTELYGLLKQAQQQLGKRIDQANATAQSLFQQAEKDAQAEAAAVQARADQQFAQATAGIAAALAQAETYAHGQAADAERQAVADVDAAIAAVSQTSWPPVTAMIGQLQKVAAPDFTALLGMLALVPTEIPATAPQAVAAADSVLPPILRLMTDCVVPQCRDLGGLRNFLHSLLSDAFDLALIAWLIYCITEPEQAAQDTIDVGGPIANDTVGALLALFGVKT